MDQFEHVFQRVGVEHLVGSGFKIGRGRLGHPLLDFGGKGTESPPQQPLQHNPLPVDATLPHPLPHSLFHSLPHPPLKTFAKALRATFPTCAVRSPESRIGSPSQDRAASNSSRHVDRVNLPGACDRTFEMHLKIGVKLAF